MVRVLRALWSLLWALFCVGLAAACIAGLYNVGRDNFDVEQMAEAAACEGEGEGCSLRRFYMDRGPTSEAFDFLNVKQEQVRVRCAREHLLIGEYACEVRDRRPYTGPVVVVAPVAAPRPATPPKGNTGGSRKARATASASAPPAAPVVEGDGGI